MEVEWESGAFPAWALPMAGDRVHIEGAHIFDCAHGVNGSYRTEIHPPRLLMTLRDAADQQWSNGTATIPPRPGWSDTMDGLGSVPIPVTRADVFASSDGGEAREQLVCFHVAFLPPAPDCPPDWYQDLRGDYDLFVPAPPQPVSGAELITKLIPRAFLHCSSDDDCGGERDELASHPEKFTFTKVTGLFESGVQIHIDLKGDEPPSLLYGFGFTLEVGWKRPAAVVPRRFKITAVALEVRYPQDQGGPGSTGFEDGEYEISTLLGDTFRHLRLVGGPKALSYPWHQSVPQTEDVNLGNFGFKTSGTCRLEALSGADTSTCQNSWDVTVLEAQPLRVFFRAEEHDGFTENDEAGAVEHFFTAPNYGVGTHVERFQERTSAGADALDEECVVIEGCLVLTYKIEDDPIPAPAQTTLSVGTPNVAQGGETWVTEKTDLQLNATAPAGQSGDTIELHARAWRTTTAAPAETVCGSGTGTAACTLHLDANDGSDGEYTLEYFSKDATTNAIEPTHTAVFRRDATRPSSSATLSGTFVRGWYNTPVTVTLSATDGAGVGVDHTTYTVDGGASTTYVAPVAVSSDSASHSVGFWSVDKLANTESAKSVGFAIDRTPPTLTVGNASDGTFTYTEDELVNGVFTNASSLAVSYASSDALSGMWQVRIDGTPVGFAGTTAVAIPSGISTHSLVAEDVAGNLTTLTFAIVSVTPLVNADPKGSGYWRNSATALAPLFDMVNIVSRAFGAPTHHYDDVTLANYQSFLTLNPNFVPDLKVRRELLTAWLNLVSGREAAAQKIDLNGPDWSTVVTNTMESSTTTALNLVRESERRLEESPSAALLTAIQTLLEKLSSGTLNKK